MWMFALGNDNRKSEILSATPSKLKVLSQWPRRKSSGLQVHRSRQAHEHRSHLAFLQFCNYFLPHRVLFQLIPTIFSSSGGAMSEHKCNHSRYKHTRLLPFTGSIQFSAFELPLHCFALLLLCLLLSTEELFPFSLLIVCVLIKFVSKSSGRKSSANDGRLPKARSSRSRSNTFFKSPFSSG